MQFRKDAQVFSADGHSVGHIDRVVLDPQTKEVTHLIVRKGLLLTKDRVLPIALITSSAEKRVNVIANANEVDQLPEFEEKQYVPIQGGEVPETTAPTPNFYWYPVAPYSIAPPIGVQPPGYVEETHRNIPEELVALKAGARVLDNQGEQVGQVEQVFSDTQSDHVTYFVLSHGVLFKERKLVPVTWIDIVSDDEIRLNVPEDRVEKLPTFEPVGH